MKRTELSILIGLILSVIISGFSAFAQDCKQVEKSVLRLHILANSDSETDQNLKIAVRDAVLKSNSELFENAENLVDAQEIAEKNIEKIRETAQAEVKRQGFDYEVRASVCQTFFETRHYENYTLPAGKYNAVRIEIGSGEGKNWWCVLFPAICVPASMEQNSPQSVFSESELNTVTNPKYEAKFMVLEVLKKLENLAKN